MWDFTFTINCTVHVTGNFSIVQYFFSQRSCKLCISKQCQTSHCATAKISPTLQITTQSASITRYIALNSFTHNAFRVQTAAPRQGVKFVSYQKINLSSCTLAIPSSGDPFRVNVNYETQNGETARIFPPSTSTFVLCVDLAEVKVKGVVPTNRKTLITCLPRAHAQQLFKSCSQHWTSSVAV